MDTATGTPHGVSQTKNSAFAMLLLVSSGLCALYEAMPRCALAETTTGVKAYHIPAQALSTALTTFGQQAHMQVSADPKILSGHQSAALNGNFTEQEALARLLTGSGLTARVSGNVVSVSTTSSITLGPVRVGGTVTHENPTGPGVGYVATSTMSATKTDTPITEIPNSIYVITKQQLVDQQPQSIQDALKYTAGVFSGAEGTASNGANTRQARAIMQRGFNSTQFVDGLLTNTQSAGEPVFLERIEAVNGPASVMYGKLTPGGMVAETLKKPTDTPLRQVSVGFGNWGRYEATLDISDKITKSGNLRYRIAAIGVTQGTQTDHVDYHRVGVLPSVTWDVDKNTSLTILGSYMYTPGDGSSPGNYYPLHGTLITDGYKRISRNSYLGIPNWNTQGEKDGMFEYQFQHKFSKYINLSQTFRYEKSEYDSNNVYYNGEGNAGEVYVQPNSWKQTYETITLDTRLSGKFKTGPVNHTWVVGTDFQDYHYSLPWKIDYTPGDSGVAVNIYNPNPNYTPCYSTAPSAGCVGSDTLARDDYFQEGIYFQDQIKWKRLSVLLGGRQDWVNYKAHSSGTDFSNSGGVSTTTSSTTTTSPQPQSAFTWRAGIIYNFDFGLTPYFSYATSFVPQMSTDYRGQPFAPLTGKQFEAGLKYKVPNRNILLTAAAFHIDEDNYLITDPVHTNFSTNAGRVRSQGFEVSANANITPNLRAIASYNYVDIRYAKTNKTAKRYNPYTDSKYGNAISEQGMSVPYVPRNMFSVFLDYSFPGNLMKGFGVNGGMRYVGFTYIDSVESFKTPAYFLFDIGAHYDFGKMIPSLRGLKAQLAVSNLANKYYVTTCSTYNCYIGQGRRVYGNLTYNW
ncbi:TonB-dependent siderophore receptor [Komagataeibacter diospyri]|uniref:TonB-dependent siderophore receptor n=1 Tax=Komagataeibacter diospyri TaxID=1932662 RepID=UPI001D052910|nr:TonB-dependent siderophore receptor [Komagataeibacter diospyri]